MSDPFEHDDAAYVLGALEPEERARFEQHLETCVDCAARVAEIAELPDLLAGLTADDFDEPEVVDEPVPDLVLQRLLSRVRAERRRRHWLVGGLSAAVAACVLALVVAVWPGGGSDGTPSARAFSAVSSTPVQASAVLAAKSWGTEIEVYCRFAPGTDAPATGWTYDLYAITPTGRQYLSDWTLKPGPQISYVTGTSIAAGDIQALEITSPDAAHTPLLRLTV
jgi:hypothetical protein